MLIREVILENFMSYEYAKIPLKPGLNVVCGPNGSGKSSILLAISVALGQAYTERSRRLSDLIRWGKEGARVTLVFDNAPVKHRRPVPMYDVDYFRISRYINKDGNYWFETNFQTVTKSEVSSILNEFGINPDNMLIIMHQNMMEEFGTTTPEEKLRMTEEAVGLGQYRTSILEAQHKLEQVLSEEQSVKSLMVNAEETLAYWKGEFEKFLKRKALIEEKGRLERELVWAQYIRHENMVNSWLDRIAHRKDELNRTLSEIMDVDKSVVSLYNLLRELRQEHLGSFYSLLEQEKERIRQEVTSEVQLRNLQRLSDYIIPANSNSSSSLFDQGNLEKYLKETQEEIVISKARANEHEAKAAKLRSGLTKLEDRADSMTEEYLDRRVRKGILEFQRGVAEDDIRSLERELKVAQKALDDMRPLIGEAGSRIETKRMPQEVSEDLKIVGVQLATLGEISEEVERMYHNYLAIFDELKAKVVIVAQNRQNTLQEVEERKRKWRETLESILDEVSKTYGQFLSAINARGRVRLVNAQDIEASGLELVVGFRGAEPQVLNAYTQSGGERSSATVLFLLALQQYLRSPFRSVDEFDVHLDPRNREVISEILLREMGRHRDIQYLTITPGQITAIQDDVHVITVQNVSGRSEVMVVR